MAIITHGIRIFELLELLVDFDVGEDVKEGVRLVRRQLVILGHCGRLGVNIRTEFSMRLIHIIKRSVYLKQYQKLHVMVTWATTKAR